MSDLTDPEYQKALERLDNAIEDMAARTLGEMRDKLYGPPAKLLSTLELAARLGVHEETCRRWVKLGCPCTELPGGRKRFELSLVTAWLKARRAA